MINPVAELIKLQSQGAARKTLLTRMNRFFAVVKYGGKTVVARIVDKDLDFISDVDFHKMFANLVVFEKTKKGSRPIRVSKEWWNWKGRRQFLGRGVVFEPGGPLEIPNDMINLWRG